MQATSGFEQLDSLVDDIKKKESDRVKARYKRRTNIHSGPITLRGARGSMEFPDSRIAYKQFGRIYPNRTWLGDIQSWRRKLFGA